MNDANLLAGEKLLSYLKFLQSSGEREIALNREARNALNQLFRQLKAHKISKKLNSQPQSQPQPQAKLQPKTTAIPKSAPEIKTSPSLSTQTKITVSKPFTVAKQETPASKVISSFRGIKPIKIQKTLKTNKEKIAQLKELLQEDEGIKNLATLRTQMVFSAGNPDAKLMLIGEAPGADEETEGEPFVGSAGALLNKILNAMGLKRQEIYISNVVKYRPKIGNLTNQLKSNRKPTREEVALCLPYILAEIEIVQPELIMALGGTSAEALLDKEMPVARFRQSIHHMPFDLKLDKTKGEIPVIVSYHPSYLLRNPALSERRKVWEDMLKAMEILQMQITEKQRGFFQK